MDIDADIEMIERVMSGLHNTPCSYALRKEQPCLEPRRGEGVYWRDMKPERMCAGCAAYWYLAQAKDELQRMQRSLIGTTVPNLVRED